MPTKTLLITGASSGIGLATARLCAAQGYRIGLVARREALLREIQSEIGGEVLAHDVAQGPGALAEFAEGLGGDELVLVNNAGIAQFGPYDQMKWEDALAQIQVNLAGLMAATHAVLPRMLADGRGQIVNVLSIAARHVFPGAEAYAASKAGALMFGQSLSASYRKHGIRVCNMLPGSTDTPIWDAGGWKPDAEDMLTPEAVAEAVVAVISAPDNRSFDEITLMPPKGIL